MLDGFVQGMPAPETKQQIEGLLFHLAGYPVAVQVVEETWAKRDAMSG